MIKAVFLDMDDTLIFNQALYEAAKKKLCAYMQDFGVSPEETVKVYDPTDKELFKTFGYSRNRFPTTFETVLKHFVPEADAEMVKTARGFAETVFDTVADIKPGVPEAIELLSSGRPVYIVTAGDRSVQEDRLSHLPFKEKLSGMFIVEKKDKETYAEIVQKLGFKPEEVVMMGDSLRSDIVPAVAAGLHAVWIEADNWSLEAVSDLPKERVYKAPSLLEAARHVTRDSMPDIRHSPRKKSSSPAPK
jgi:putative hydrolase of the HAD superfamily